MRCARVFASFCATTRQGQPQHKGFRPMADDHHDVATLATNLARNQGWAVFPVGGNKNPVWPKAKGGSGYKDGSKDPDRIAWLWRHWPGPLIGIATGAMSGVSVLDVDLKHDAALAWWQANEARLPRTRAYRTRSGGIHLH